MIFNNLYSGLDHYSFDEFKAAKSILKKAETIAKSLQFLSTNKKRYGLESKGDL